LRRIFRWRSAGGPRVRSGRAVSPVCKTRRGGCPSADDPDQPLLREGAVGAGPGRGAVRRATAPAASPHRRCAVGRRGADGPGVRDRPGRGARRLDEHPALGRHPDRARASALPRW
jgi:hypothetical protein